MSSEDAEDLLHDSVIELFDLSDYSSTLPNDAKETCDCPYVIENEYWTSSTKELETILPSVEFGDVWNYLVYRKHCKSYEIIFGDGLFFEFKALKLTNNNFLAKAKVHHSMAFSLPPLRPWVAFNPAGGVITAHCDCIAGLGECCSHVGAIIFGALVVNAQKTTLTVTDQPMKWLRKSVKPVTYSYLYCVNTVTNFIISIHNIHNLSIQFQLIL
ncbi:hypothetical protein GHT06_009130 [Daphnia sinensis]|uniref:SWIM-type domain-containing protein n=1 Tax=Daphnia sinensis TaxID=1820382 RepID=A0AAD5LWG8_9CRUS|nr:hypothetical protein GHT06_009130 [Daphnia sinensis]